MSDLSRSCRADVDGACAHDHVDHQAVDITVGAAADQLSLLGVEAAHLVPVDGHRPHAGTSVNEHGNVVGHGHRHVATTKSHVGTVPPGDIDVGEVEVHVTDAVLVGMPQIGE